MMGLFEKAWGEGFRVHGFDLGMPGVTEAVPLYGGTGKWNEKWGEWGSGRLNPRFDGHPIDYHDMSSMRGSGTGATGTYYHAGPFTPLQVPRYHLEELLESVKRPNHNRVHIAPKNPIMTGTDFRDLSYSLLRNVHRNAEGNMQNEHLNSQGHQEIEEVSVPEYRSRPIFRDISGVEGEENSIDALLRPYRLRPHDSSLEYWSNLDDLAPPGGIKRRKEGQMSIETAGRGDHDRDFINYLGLSPLVQRIYGKDAAHEDDWMVDPDVLDELNARMLDLGGLSPMNILLSGLGHDAVVPLLQRDRGSAYGGREINQGSVLLPPAEDDWWVDYHPTEGGRFNELKPEHVQTWLDEMDRNREILAERFPGSKTLRTEEYTRPRPVYR